MFNDLEITLIAEEAPADGTNLVLRYADNTVTGTFSLSTLADAIAQLDRALAGDKPAADLLKDAGATLFEALLDRRGYGIYTSALASARKEGHTLRLRINSERPLLTTIPWEYLYDQDEAQWISLAPDQSLVRSLPVTSRAPQPVDESLRVLVMVSDPIDLEPLQSEVELANLEAAADVAAIDLLIVEPSYAALQAALRDHQPHIVHYVGHGHFDEEKQEGALLLKDENRRRVEPSLPHPQRNRGTHAQLPRRALPTL